MVTSTLALTLIRMTLSHNPDTYFYWMEELSVGAVPSRASWRDLRAKRSTLLLRKQQMKEFISNLCVIPSASGPMKIFCDNTGAIALAKESRFHKKTKHINRRFNSIRDLVKEVDIEICKIHTDLNVADPLTKPLPRAKHDQHQGSMGVRIIIV